MSEKRKTKLCKYCKTEILYNAKVCPQCRKKQGMGIIPKAVIAILVLGVIGNAIVKSDWDESMVVPTEKATVIETETSTETTAEETTSQETAAQETEVEEKIPTEYKSALNKAYSYSKMMDMSKAGIYDQLVSEYGENFSPDAAQYAIDNIEIDWNENALKKAQSYGETMFMSKMAIYDQLISEYGEKFTEEEAQYAIDHVQIDWNENALEKAKSYQQTMDMSPAAIRDQLVSEYGEKFTAEEADYAIEHLD